MSVSSMTGFARVEGAAGGTAWVCEARSVNGRNLDVKIRAPLGWEALEPVAREAAAKRFKRGSIQIGLTQARDQRAAQARLDHDQIAALIAAAAPYVASGAVAPPRWDGLLQARGVMISDDAAEPVDRTALAALFAGAIDQALDALRDARRSEGRALAALLNGLIDRIEALVGAARATAGAAPEAIGARLHQRIAALAPEVALDPARFAQEVALIAARGDVTEELDRLSAHAAEARALLNGGEAAGRRLDFLAQEFAREANTLCAKSADLALTRIGLDLKTAVDQLKEQSANVE
ncbi:MAG: YicC/YloC family endoribonuclease [Hyphomonadaceae bacterium]|nr:YicC/YloC family endoribonuclease [Hyphomonadaceae bacterium]